MRRPALPLGLLVTLLLLLLPARPALAHKVNLFALGRGNRIEGQVRFGRDHPVAGATVTLLGPAGEELAAGRSGPDGRFAFVVTQRADYRVRVVLADGHGATFRVPAAELSAALPGPAPAGAASPAARFLAPEKAEQEAAGTDGERSPARRAPPPATEAQAPATVPGAAPVLTARELAAVLERYEARQRELYHDFRSQERWRDIVAGIGYIFGLAGVYALARTRRRG
jgi:nickel transport protein